MHTDLPKSYLELLDKVSSYEDVRMPNPERVLQSFGFKSHSLNAQAPVFYVVDYVQEKYLYIDPSCQTLLGYNVKKLMETGPDSFTRFWHKCDFKIFNEKIFPKTIDFLKSVPCAAIQDYSFSFNYRIATKDGAYLAVLQRSTYYLATSDKVPLAAVGFIIDISNIKDDAKIIFTIDHIDAQYKPVNQKPLFREVFYPDRGYHELSKREVEVLQCIYAGMSSKQIADKLFVSLNTINNHRKHMLEKTHSKNTADLLHYASKHGIL